MTEQPKRPFFSRIQWLGSEILLGTLVALLSIFTGVASYQGSMSDSDQNKYQNEGMQALTDANAEYLTANQYIVYDYSLYDSWYVTDDPEKAQYYQDSFSEALTTSIATTPDDPFSDAYYEEQYAYANELFATADENFNLAEEFNGRGDKLQMVMLTTAIGLAFAAWGSLLQDENPMRLMFAALALLTTAIAIFNYLQVPVVVV